MKKYKIFIIVFMLLIFVISIFYFSAYRNLSKVSAEKCDAYFENLYETTKPGQFKISYTDFNGSETRAFNALKGYKINVKYNSNVKNGTLSIVIKDPNGNILSTLPTNKSGSLNILANATGKFSIVITGTGTSGYVKILWKRIFFKTISKPI
jgi:hypothetical protein